MNEIQGMSLAAIYKYINCTVGKLLALVLVTDYVTNYSIIIIMIFAYLLLASVAYLWKKTHFVDYYIKIILVVVATQIYFSTFILGVWGRCESTKREFQGISRTCHCSKQISHDRIGLMKW